MTDRPRQLIRNADFADGLRDWHGEGDGVAHVTSAGQRVLRLRGTQKQPARVASAPVDVVPGATYVVSADFYSESPAEASIDVAWLASDAAELERHELATPQPMEAEVTAPPGAVFASVRVSCLGGELFVRAAGMSPVGYRLVVTALETELPVVLSRVPSSLVCEIHNAGSEPVPNPHVELTAGREFVAPPAEAAFAPPPLAPGARYVVAWPLLISEPGVYGVQVRARGAGRVTEVATSVVVGEEPLRLADDGSGLTARRSHFSLSTRTFRIVMPRLEHGFGTGQFDFDDPRRFGGWIPFLGTARGEAGEPPRPLYGRKSRVAGTTIVLYNSDQLAEWELTLRPSAERHSITLATDYVCRKPHVLTALDGAPLYFADGASVTDWLASPNSCVTVAQRGERRFAARVRWREANTSAVTITAAPPGRLRPACARLELRQQQMVPGRRVFWQQELWVGPVRGMLEAK